MTDPLTKQLQCISREGCNTPVTCQDAGCCQRLNRPPAPVSSNQRFDLLSNAIRLLRSFGDAYSREADEVERLQGSQVETKTGYLDWPTNTYLFKLMLRYFGFDSEKAHHVADVVRVVNERAAREFDQRSAQETKPDDEDSYIHGPGTFPHSDGCRCERCSPPKAVPDCGNPVMVNAEWYGPCTLPSGHEGDCKRVQKAPKAHVDYKVPGCDCLGCELSPKAPGAPHETK